MILFLDPTVPFIELTEVNDNYEVSCTQRYFGSSVEWNVKINAHPEVDKIEWINNKNDKISNSTKYDIFQTNEESQLIVKNIDYDDLGIYTFIASNYDTKKQIQFSITGI